LLWLSKRVNLDDPEKFKEFLALNDWSSGYKQNLVNAYNHYAEVNGLAWIPPRYRREETVLDIPTEETVNKIVAHASRKYSLILAVLRDTGLRIGEFSKLTLRNIDLDKGLIRVNSEKYSKPRILPVKPQTLAMLKEYVSKLNPKLDDKLFPKSDSIRKNYEKLRNNLAEKLHDPNIRKVRLHDFRHFFATMLYLKTKDIVYVQRQLGHRNIQNTLIYTHLINFPNDEYTVKVATTVEEACKLLECGFEYVTDMGAVKLFRKRK
jgi:integrase